MEFSFYGAGCIYIVTKELSILVDPPTSETGLKAPKVKADVVLFSNQAAKTDTVSSESFVVNMPGEYEIKGLSIQGIPAQLHVDKPEDPKLGVMYAVQHNDVRALITGNIDPELSDTQVESIGEVNILVIPVGGKGLTLDANAAAKLVSQFEPQYIIPVHYDDGVTKYPVPQDKLETFLQEVGVESPESKAKLKVTAKNLEQEAEVVVLERQ